MELAGFHSCRHFAHVTVTIDVKYVGLENFQTFPTIEKFDNNALDEGSDRYAPIFCIPTWRNHGSRPLLLYDL